MDRISKVQYYLDIAKTVAARSPCSRRKFGAIIVVNDNVVATGYNGTMPGALNCGIDVPCLKDVYLEMPYQSYDYCPAIHAEENACLAAGKERANGGTLYLAPAMGVGDRPCFRCRRAIKRVGIRKVIYISRGGIVAEDDTNLYVKLEDDWITHMLDEGDPDWLAKMIE